MKMKPAGYLTNNKNGLQGSTGSFMTTSSQRTASSWKRPRPLLEARLCIAPVTVKAWRRCKRK